MRNTIILPLNRLYTQDSSSHLMKPNSLISLSKRLFQLLDACFSPGHRVPFSCFALPDSFSTVPRESGPAFIFYAIGLIFDCSEGVGSLFMFCVPALIFSCTAGIRSRFHILHFWTHFPQYRGRRVPFSYFARPDSFSALPRVSGPVFMFCAPGLVFGGSESVGFRFHVLHPRTFFRR
jgi:hypothetical protein